MPVLDWVFGSQGLTGQAHLATVGPRIQIEATPHRHLQQKMLDSGLSIPPPVVGAGLIDTGASITSIDVSIAAQLRLQQIGTRRIWSATGESIAPLYSFTFRLLPWGFNLDCVAGMGCNIHPQGIIALIGMDLLSQGVLTVHGPRGLVTFAV